MHSCNKYFQNCSPLEIICSVWKELATIENIKVRKYPTETLIYWYQPQNMVDRILRQR